MSRVPDDVPDCVWPSANEYGVPDLDPEMQADALDLPFRAWGSVARRTRFRGTWHFYTDDAKFAGLWACPSVVPRTACVAAVEANYSTNDQMPLAVVLWAVYRKRWMSRYWQASGVRVLVDLNVDPMWARLNLLGVPDGWKAFATRASDAGLDRLASQYEIARRVSGRRNPLFIVYCGGPAVRRFCAAAGCLFFVDQGNAAREGVRSA